MVAGVTWLLGSLAVQIPRGAALHPRSHAPGWPAACSKCRVVCCDLPAPPRVGVCHASRGVAARLGRQQH